MYPPMIFAPSYSLKHFHLPFRVEKDGDTPKAIAETSKSPTRKDLVCLDITVPSVRASSEINGPRRKRFASVDLPKTVLRRKHG